MFKWLFSFSMLGDIYDKMILLMNDVAALYQRSNDALPLFNAIAARFKSDNDYIRKRFRELDELSQSHRVLARAAARPPRNDLSRPRYRAWARK